MSRTLTSPGDTFGTPPSGHPTADFRFTAKARLEDIMSLDNLVEDKLREQLLNMISREPEKRSHTHA